VKSGVEGAEVAKIVDLSRGPTCACYSARMGSRREIPRPHSFDELIGQGRVVGLIRNKVQLGHTRAWMFSGDSGCGKTTIAGILALSLQCEHQKKFGNPCRECRRRHKPSRFGWSEIQEINSGQYSTLEATKNIASSAYYYPPRFGKYRIVIWDEAQKLSVPSQTLLLKYFEESPRTTVWMICTTEPKKILLPLRRRCEHYKIEGISEDKIKPLVKRAIKFLGIKKRSTPLAEALKREHVRSPGFILKAVNKYLEGEKPEKAAELAREDSADDEGTPSKPRGPTALPGGIKHTKDGVQISDGEHYFNIMVWTSKKPGRAHVRFAMAGRRYDYYLDAANMKRFRQVLARGGN
jgi:hypothetical protein